MKHMVVALTTLMAAFTVSAGDAKIVFLAGPPSHGPGDHEHRAGCLLLKACLDKVPGVTSEVYSNGWPQNPEAAFAGAATLVVYSDGGPGHPLLQDDRLKTLGALMKKGVGLVMPPLRRGARKGQGREGIPGLDRRLLRDGLVGQPDLAARVQAHAHAPRHPRRPTAAPHRRVVFPHALPRRHEGRGADPVSRAAREHDGPPRRPARRQPGGARGRAPRRARRLSRGPTNAPTADAASASPAATTTGTGATMTSAS